MYKRIAFFIITLFFFVIISAVSINAQDAAKVAPNIYKVKFENERVRVLDVQSNPGDKSDWHSHPGGKENPEEIWGFWVESCHIS